MSESLVDFAALLKRWGAGMGLRFGAVGAFPLAADAKDAALLVTLDPGSYDWQFISVSPGFGDRGHQSCT